MKIAFCISGQVRNFEHYFPLLRELADRHEAKVFFSTWKKRGTKIGGVLGKTQLARIFGYTFVSAFPDRLLEEGALISLFPSLIDDLNASDLDDLVSTNAIIADHFPDAIVDIEDESLLDLRFESKAHDNNSLRMLYKIWRCNRMKASYEAASKSKFDLVYRFRPDVIIPNLSSEQVGRCTVPGANIVLVDAFRDGWVSDFSSIASSRVDDIYTSLFGRLVDRGPAKWTGIHRELSAHLLRNGLSLEEYGPEIRPLESPLRRVDNRSTFLRQFPLCASLDQMSFSPPELALLELVLLVADDVENKSYESAKHRLETHDYGEETSRYESDLIAGYLQICATLCQRLRNDRLSQGLLLLSWTHRIDSQHYNSANRDKDFRYNSARESLVSFSLGADLMKDLAPMVDLIPRSYQFIDLVCGRFSEAAIAAAMTYLKDGAQ